MNKFDPDLDRKIITSLINKLSLAGGETQRVDDFIDYARLNGVKFSFSDIFIAARKNIKITN